MSRTYVIRTFGCQMNEHDSERIAGLLEADGMQRGDEVGEADVVVLNTCCIRENADNKLYAALGDLKRAKQANPQMQIAVAGCLAQKDRELIQDRAGHVDVVFGTHNVGRAAELLSEARANGPIMEILEETVADDLAAFPSALPARREADYAAWVTIQIGCDNQCAFCIVPQVRGVEMSRPFGDLVAEAERLVADGVIEITLLGQNVNSYGRDLALKLRGSEPDPLDAHVAGIRWAESDRRARPLFADLLRAVGAVEGIRRVRYVSPHPKDLRPETIQAMAEVDTVVEHLHLPVQSGSDRILAAMHRGYTAERYLERLTAARAGIDDLSVTTDVIVGFPGETEDDFEQTLQVAAEAQYDSVFAYIFSPRPNTEAADLTADFVDHSVAVDRFERLRLVTQRSALRGNHSRVGRLEEVVVEGPSKRDEMVLSGRTRQNRMIHFPSSEQLRVGTIANVRCTEGRSHYLMGELDEIVAKPTHRTRIPVVAG